MADVETFRCGHPKTPENSRRRPGGRVSCRACYLAAQERIRRARGAKPLSDEAYEARYGRKKAQVQQKKPPDADRPSGDGARTSKPSDAARARGHNPTSRCTACGISRSVGQISDDGRCLACKLEGRQPKAAPKKQTLMTLDRRSTASFLGVSEDTLDRFVSDGDLTHNFNHTFNITDLQAFQEVLRQRAVAWKAGKRTSPRFKTTESLS